MSVISMMELNAKNPFLWDWENLVMFSSKAVEAPKKQQLVDSELDVMEGFEAASFYSSGGGRSDVGSGGSASASDLGYGSSSKSSKSASIDSSTNKEMRESLFRLDANNYSLKDPDCKRELANNPWQSKISPTTQSPIRSGESLICLKLGRTYSEDVSAGNNGKNAASVPVPVDNSTGKRSKLSSLSTEIPRCQVEGCDLDLSSAKDYHRKHRVCESHSKSPRVVVAGLERRFCQQCSRFHNISEFDQKKRSCRKRLSDHNARRRKPKPEVIQFNPMRLSSSLYDGRRQIAFNQAPVVRPRADPSSGWDFSAASKAPQASLGLFSTTQTGGHNELHLPRNEPQNYGVSKHLHHSTQLLPSKGVSNDVFSEGIQVSSTPPNLDANQNLRALSLLSTNSWGSCEPSLTPLNQPRLSNHHTRGSQPLPSMHPPPVNSEYWQGGQQAPEGAATSGLNASTPHKTDVDSNSQFQEFQLFKAPSEPSFYLY